MSSLPPRTSASSLQQLPLFSAPSACPYGLATNAIGSLELHPSLPLIEMARVFVPRAPIAPIPVSNKNKSELHPATDKDASREPSQSLFSTRGSVTLDEDYERGPTHDQQHISTTTATVAAAAAGSSGLFLRLSIGSGWVQATSCSSVMLLPQKASSLLRSGNRTARRGRGSRSSSCSSSSASGNPVCRWRNLSVSSIAVPVLSSPSLLSGQIIDTLAPGRSIVGSRIVARPEMRATFIEILLPQQRLGFAPIGDPLSGEAWLCPEPLISSSLSSGFVEWVPLPHSQIAVPPPAVLLQRQQQRADASSTSAASRVEQCAAANQRFIDPLAPIQLLVDPQQQETQHDVAHSRRRRPPPPAREVSQQQELTGYSSEDELAAFFLQKQHQEQQQQQQLKKEDVLLTAQNNNNTGRVASRAIFKNNDENEPEDDGTSPTATSFSGSFSNPFHLDLDELVEQQPLQQQQRLGSQSGQRSPIVLPPPPPPQVPPLSPLPAARHQLDKKNSKPQHHRKIARPKTRADQ